MTKNYAIEILTESHIEEAATLIAKCFSGRGPMEEAYTSSFEEFREYLIYESHKCAKEFSGFIARSTKDQSIVGAVLNCDLADTLNSDYFLGEAKQDPVIAILYELNKDYFGEEPVRNGQYFNTKFLAVSGAFAGQGIACELAEKSLVLAAAKGFRFMHTEAANPTSQHIYMNRLGLEERVKIHYSEFSFNNGKPFSTANPDENIKLVIKEI